VDVFRSLLNPSSPDALQYGAAYQPRLVTTFEFVPNENSLVIEQQSSPPDIESSLADVRINSPELYEAIVAAFHAKYTTRTLPASPAMAGVYATVDRNRGVWKAPSNVGITGFDKLTLQINDEEQGWMNVDPTGKAINAIRKFAGRGTLVWGTRTFAGNDNEWRYVPVRRLFIFAEESIQKALSPMVFEPNTAVTWARVKGMVGGFLTNLWRQGALAGAKPEHAFFVNVGLGVTMTAQDILEGRLIVDVGLAAVRPAEFIVMRFMHKLQEAE
jgi:uncharacterized protein